jgi:hypothetical protein
LKKVPLPTSAASVISSTVTAGKSALGKQVQRAAEKPQPGFGGAALTASGARMICLAAGSQSLDERGRSRIMMVAHIRMLVNNDHRSFIVRLAQVV